MTAERRRFRARTDALPRVSAFVEAGCRRLGGGRETALRLVLVAEELFINTVEHGYGGDSLKTVELRLRATGHELELTITDRAPPFNPFNELPEPLTAADPRELRVGGLGCALVAGITSRHVYERCGPLNRVTVGVPRRTGTPARAKKVGRNTSRRFR
ncbi:MAG TPA: ATP-binding protein [Verrucomicrobiae bacterium]|nr:ATP-binding protein [Verrucomicrobiae bacterium]